jgi:hypothetical protein
MPQLHIMGQSLQKAIVVAATALLAASAGIGIGLGQYLLVAAMLFAIPTVQLLKNQQLVLFAFAGLTLLITGTLKFFWELSQFQWILSVLGVILLSYVALKRTFETATQKTDFFGDLTAIGLWWIIVIFSSTANGLPALNWLVGLRIYLPAFGVFAYIAYCRPGEQLLKSIFIFMLAIASMQWAFCLYQKLYIVPIRLAGNYPGSAWDSIVGTFGGDKFGGGESGSLGIYLSLMVILAIALKKQGQLKTIWFSLAIFPSFAAMAIVESKVIALLIPAGIFLVYRNHAVTKPVTFIAGSFCVAFLMLALLVSYYYLYWQTDNNKSFLDALFDRIFYSFDPQFQASATNLGRVKSLIYWWDHHSLFDNPLTLLFGHGLASAVSSSSIIGEGTAVRAHAVMLDVTGISKLLWETGLVGSLTFMSIFVMGALRARQLKTNLAIPIWHRASMQGVEAGLALMPLTIFYEVTIVSSPPMQFTAMFFLGYVAYWRRESSRTRHG